VRTLERDVAGLTAANPYTGTTQKIANYLADPATRWRSCTWSTPDPARTPTFALCRQAGLLPHPRLGQLQHARACRSNPAFAYNHGDYAAEINTNSTAFAWPRS